MEFPQQIEEINMDGKEWGKFKEMPDGKFSFSDPGHSARRSFILAQIQQMENKLQIIEEEIEKEYLLKGRTDMMISNQNFMADKLSVQEFLQEQKIKLQQLME